MKRKRLYAFAALIGLLMISVLAVVMLLSTQSGSRWLIQHVRAHIPGQLSIHTIQGAVFCDLELQGIDYRLAQQHVAIDRIALKWDPLALLHATVHIRSLAIEGLTYTAPGDRQSDKPFQVPETLALPLAVVVDDAHLHRFQFRRRDFHQTIDQLQLAGHAEGETLQLKRFEVQAGGAQLMLHGQSGLSQPYALEATLRWRAQLPDNTPADGSGMLSGKMNALQIEHALNTPFIVKTRGEVRLGGRLPEVHFQGDWQHLRWPLKGQAQYQSKHGQYQIAGTLDAYQVTVQGDVSGQTIPPMKLHAHAKGNQTSVRIDTLEAHTLGGTVTVRGPVIWKPKPSWDLVVNATQINPGERWPQWRGKLALDAKVSGYVEAGQPQLDIQLSDLSGRLRKRALRAQGDFLFRESRLHSDKLQVTSGPNRLNASGRLDTELDVAFDLDAPDLAGLWPGLKGELRGNGRLQGPPANPHGTVSVAGRNLNYEGHAVQSLNVEVVLDAIEVHNAQATIEAIELKLGDEVFSRVSLRGAGWLKNHRILAEANAPEANVRIELTGSYQPRTWNGAVDTASLDLKQHGLWRLREPIALQISPTEVKPFSACWVLEGARVCGQGVWTKASGWLARAEARALPFERLRPLFPQHLALSGVLNANATASDTGQGLTARLEAESKSGQIRYSPPEAETQRSTYDDARLTASLVDHDAQADFAVALEQGRIGGNLQVSGFDRPDALRPLRGAIDVHVPDLRFIKLMTPELEVVSGSVQIGATLAGTLAAPAIRGRATLSNGAAKLLRPAIELKDIRLTAQNQGLRQVVLNGEARSGKGRVEITGLATLDPDAGWPYRLRIKGEHFTVARLPEVYATASPDLTINGRTHYVQVTGSLLIPQAKIQIKKLPPHTVPVSPDQVIVSNGERMPSKRTERLAIWGRIDLKLGDEVTFNGFGLDTALGGELAIHGQPAKPTMAQGELALREGRYQAYGQDLSIERGKFIFSGPVDNPAVDIRAVRKTDNVTAGLNIAGTLKSPETTIFSDPAMSEAEALSYLLRGKSLSSVDQGESDVLNTAALSLGLKAAAPITKEISDTLGLDALGLESAGGTGQTALLVGKQLAPDLYVNYVYGVFDQIGLFQITYTLSKHLSLKAESGAVQAMDLNYNFESD